MKTRSVCRPSFHGPPGFHVFKIMPIALVYFLSVVKGLNVPSRQPIATVYTFRTGPVSQRVSRWATSQTPVRPQLQNGFSYQLAMVSPLPDEDLPEVEEADTDYEVAKSQIYSELLKIESLFKRLLTRIINHCAEYLKHKAAQSYLQFYIISPLGSGLGNLLNNRLNDQYITSKLGIPENATPETFNMPYSRVDIPSNFGSKVPKHSWLIRSTNPTATKAFILLHGWFGNMQSCLQFADTLRKIGCLDTHHILILNMHEDSGKSFETNIGLKGVGDIYDASVYLHGVLGVDDISLYTQSISSLSALLFDEIIARTKRNEGYPDCGMESGCPFINAMDPGILSRLSVNRIIMESPVANVRQHIVNSPSDSVKWFTEQLLSSMDRDGLHVDKLSLQAFLRNPETCSKVYIMQGSKDSITTPEMLYNELTREKLPGTVNLFLFQEGGHTNLSATSNPEYFYALKRAIVGRNIWEIIMGRGTKTRIHNPDDLVNGK
ncbi:hypothetical protein BaOVIS_004090 [Babesia ovis]|uniref:Uncharacterized protein n=1 Tax=Babesia ovis TaxID=5869 RepID=A0A9W5T847_BABOV|nr:hypothetical protein BaOVIS_004090 [Babesia ovis]